MLHITTRPARASSAHDQRTHRVGKRESRKEECASVRDAASGILVTGREDDDQERVQCATSHNAAHHGHVPYLRDHAR